MAGTIRIVPQDEIAKGTADPPQLRLPRPGLFADRARRLEALAASEHPDAGYLRFIARVCAAQDRAFATPSIAALPDELHLQRSRTHGLPPLGIDRPSPAWRQVLKRIVTDCREGASVNVAQALDGLSSASDAELDDSAKSLLEFDYPAVDPAQAPFIAAALQVQWAAMACALGEGAVGPLEVPNLCPVCGTPPVASVLAIDVPAPGTRYLHCALCASEWRFPRGQCTCCEEREKVAYFHVEGDKDYAKAEACEACHGYLKVFNREKASQADPVADDLATLALDVLTDNAGYQRAGPNLFFVPGSS